MKLYDVKRGSKFIILTDCDDDDYQSQKSYILHHTRGMYGYCIDNDGDVTLITTWAEVELV